MAPLDFRGSPNITYLIALIGGGRGFNPEPQFRDIMELIWTCVLTAFACMWTILHLNLPASKDGIGARISRKSRWGILGTCRLRPMVVGQTVRSGNDTRIGHWYTPSMLNLVDLFSARL